jgi:hypothetical protein
MRLALIAVAVLLAGCPAIGPQGGVTPAPTPESAPEAVPYPPGLGPWGVGDSAGLASAHRDALNSTAYTLVSTRRIVAPNDSLRSLLSVTVRLSADRDYRVAVRTAGTDGPLLLGRPPARGAYWSNGSVYVRALTRNNETAYNQFRPPDAFTGTWRYWRSTAAFGGAGGFDYETFRTTFGAIGTELVRTSESNGTRLYHLEGDTARRSEFAKVGSGPVRNVTLRATISESGLVRQFHLQYERRVDGEWVTVTWNLTYENVGSTTVERPSWFDRTGPRSSVQDESPS